MDSTARASSESLPSMQTDDLEFEEGGEMTELSIAARPAEIPAEPGVYLFVSPAGEVLYAGSSSRLRDRYSSHPVRNILKPTGGHFRYLTCSLGDLVRREQELISHYSPKLNKRPASRPASLTPRRCGPGTNIRTTAEDRAHEKKVRAIMVKLGFSAQSLTISDVIRFAMKKAAEGK